MKKLISTATGGQKIFWNDFRWGSQGFTEAIGSHIKSVCDPTKVTILWGCDKTVVSGTVTISAGAIAFNNEIYRVVENTFIETVASEFWQPETLYDPTGLKQLNNTGVSVDCYEEVIYKAGYGVAPIDAILYTDSDRYMARITSLLVRDSWTLVNTQVIPPGEIAPGTYNIHAMKDLNGFVHLRGQRHFEDQTPGDQNELLFTLPVGKRPVVEHEFAISMRTAANTVGTSIFKIKTNGEVRLIFANTGFVTIVDFAQIPAFYAG